MAVLTLIQTALRWRNKMKITMKELIAKMICPQCGGGGELSSSIVCPTCGGGGELNGSTKLYI